MINEYCALTVGHKAREIVQVGEKYNAWVVFKVQYISAYIIPVNDNRPKFFQIPVIDVKVLNERVQRGMSDDIAVLTVSYKMEIELRIINFL